VSRNSVWATSVVAMMLVVTGACSAPAEEERLTSRGTLRVATKIDEPGIGNYTDPSGAERSGLDIDIARYVADRLGVDLQWEEVVSESREDMIINGHTDLVVASYSITDDRKKKVAFAGPYLIVGQDVMIRIDDTSITTVEDLKDKGKKVCSVLNSTSLGRLINKYLIPRPTSRRSMGTKSVSICWSTAGSTPFRQTTRYSSATPMNENTSERFGCSAKHSPKRDTESGWHANGMRTANGSSPSCKRWSATVAGKGS
jgi:hypothetical protein